MKTNTTEKITWTASNNSTYLLHACEANTILGAKRAAKDYLRNALCGEGVVSVMVDGQEVWQCERSIFTGFREIATNF